MTIFYVSVLSDPYRVASFIRQYFMLEFFLIQIYLFWVNWYDIQFSLQFLVRLRKGLASSKITITLRFIMNRFKEIYGRYLVYLPILYMVSGLYLKGDLNRRV